MPEDLPFPQALLDRAKKIKLFLMDVDGTLTDGGVCLISPSQGGEILEMKVFNAKDGAGLTLAHIMDIKTGFISGRKSPAVQQRAREVHVDYVYLGQATKTTAFEECMQTAGVTADETAYIGDDLPDLPLVHRAGLAVAVADSAAELRVACHFVTNARGGQGAAREVIELILKAQGRWEEAIPKALT